jgi:hypothetical protein
VTAAIVSITFIGSRSLVFAASGTTSGQIGQTGAAEPPLQAPPEIAAQTHHEHEMLAPSNLKVLPRNLTGEQVHEIMHKWSAELGTGCKTCHVADPKNVGPDGKPRLNYADDSKEEKRTARVMFKMAEDINANYVSKIDSSGAPVTCGTCHRGHLGPEPYVPAAAAEHAH